jgi:hypothetical protein
MGHNERIEGLQRTTQALRSANNTLEGIQGPRPKKVREYIQRGALVGGVCIELVRVVEELPGIGRGQPLRVERHVVRRDQAELYSARPWGHPTSQREALQRAEREYTKALKDELAKRAGTRTTLAIGAERE